MEVLTVAITIATAGATTVAGIVVFTVFADGLLNLSQFVKRELAIFIQINNVHDGLNAGLDFGWFEDVVVIGVRFQQFLSKVVLIRARQYPGSSSAPGFACRSPG